MLLDKDAILQHAAVLHHDDLSIARYVDGVQRRYDKIRQLGASGRLTVILPWNVDRTMEQIDEDAGYPSQAESASGELPRSVTFARNWRAFHRKCRQIVGPEGESAVRIFDGRTPMRERIDNTPHLNMLLQSAQEQLNIDDLRTVPSLPDCWIWVSREFLDLGRRADLSADIARERLCTVIGNRESRMDEFVRQEDVRIVEVSKARFNPRYRGRIVAQSGAVKQLLLHMTLCVVASDPFEVCFPDRAGARSRGRDAA